MILYKVQCGAFAIKRNAEKQATRIITKTGLKPCIVREGILYKVQCGAFSKSENAISRANYLSDKGFSVRVFTVGEEDVVADDAPKSSVRPRIRLWGINFMDENQSLYGNAKALIEYAEDNKTIEHVIVIDGGMSSGTTVKKLKEAGVKTIDALVLSHAHGDHYGCWTKIFDNFTVKHVYLPDTKELDKYQKSYGNAIRNQEKKAKKKKAAVTYMKAGVSFTVGSILCECIYQLPASSVSEHDNHHFVNNESIVTRFTIDGTWIFHTAGDLQNAGNNALIKYMKSIGQSLRCHIIDIQWHGDPNATNDALCSETKPFIALDNYHNGENSGGRKTTYNRFKKVGALVCCNHKLGDIYIDMIADKATVTCSKDKNYKEEFTA